MFEADRQGSLGQSWTMMVSQIGGTPQSSIEIGIFHKPSILRYPNVWKPPCLLTSYSCSIVCRASIIALAVNQKFPTNPGQAKADQSAGFQEHSTNMGVATGTKLPFGDDYKTNNQFLYGDGL